MNEISSFTGKYAFLSNFYPAPVTYMGQTYANNEAAFQAQKTRCAKEQQQFSWGTVNGHGENQLGIILMDVREKLKWSYEVIEYERKDKMQ